MRILACTFLKPLVHTLTDSVLTVMVLVKSEIFERIKYLFKLMYILFVFVLFIIILENTSKQHLKFKTWYNKILLTSNVITNCIFVVIFRENTIRIWSNSIVFNLSWYAISRVGFYLNVV